MMLAGAVRVTGAKFQMARTPPATSKSATLCALSAGVVIMPI